MHHPNSSSPVLYWVLIPLFVLIIYPLLYLFIISLQKAGQTGLSFAAYTAVLADRQLPVVLFNTLYVSLGSTALSVIIGCGGALLTERTDLPGRQFWRLLFLFPVLLPSYVLSVAWQHWLGPVGMLNEWFVQLFGQPLWILSGLNGITMVMAISHIPVPYLLVRTALLSSPPELDDAARIGGAGPLQVFRFITMPLLAPSIVGGALLCFAGAIDNFGIPAFIGIPAGVTVLSTFIYQKVIGLGVDSFEQAAALSVITGCIAVLPVYLQNYLFRGTRYRREEGGRNRRIYSMGAWRWGLLFLIVLWFGFSMIGPFGAMFITSLTPAYGVTPSLANLTLAHYLTLWQDIPAVVNGFANSLVLALGSVLIILILTWPVARAAALAPTSLTRAIDAIGAVPYCLPGMVVALAVLLVWIRPLPGVSFSLYGGLVILFLAYLARFFTFGIRIWVAAWSRFAPALEEAGRIAGANTRQAAWHIVLPDFRGEALGGALLIYLLAFTELTLSSLLAGSQTPTLGLTIFQLESAGQALESAALGTLLTLLSLILAWSVTGYLLGPSNKAPKEK